MGKSRNAGLETIAKTQVRVDSTLDQGGCGGDFEKQLDSGFIFKVDLIGIADESDGKCERGESKVTEKFGLEKPKEQISSH